MKLLILFHIIVFSTGVYLFLSGYFPLTQCVENDIFYKTTEKTRHVDRIVLMVIDALREDLSNSTAHMPFLNSLYNVKNSCYYSTKIDVPTVTMPRIKALTTGVVPNFIDIVFNFDSKKLIVDNLLQRSVDDGLVMTFFGDDTWLKLFPNLFKRNDGTTSFFVTDYSEVDNNVTRHLESELKMLDWNIMILHYLGLDHIGHLDGPRSHLMPAKLSEMDSIIRKIYNGLKDWESKTNGKSLLLVTGDHGMKDTGGHGGASKNEVTVPFISIGMPCYSSSIEQIDIAATLAILLNIPFPKSSVGSLIPGLLQKLSIEQLALAYESYFKHIFSLLKKNSMPKYQEIENQYLQFLLTDDVNDPAKSIHFYMKKNDEIKMYIIKSHVTFDTFSLTLGKALIWTTSVRETIKSLKRFIQLL